MIYSIGQAYLVNRAEGALTKTARCWLLLPGVYAMCGVCVVYCSTLMTSKRYVSPLDRGSEDSNLPENAFLVTLLRWISAKTLQFFCGKAVYGSTSRQNETRYWFLLW